MCDCNCKCEHENFEPELGKWYDMHGGDRFLYLFHDSSNEVFPFNGVEEDGTHNLYDKESFKKLSDDQSCPSYITYFGQKKELKLEVGKYYATANGSVVKVVKIVGSDMHGRVVKVSLGDIKIGNRPCEFEVGDFYYWHPDGSILPPDLPPLIKEVDFNEECHSDQKLQLEKGKYYSTKRGSIVKCELLCSDGTAYCIVISVSPTEKKINQPVGMVSFKEGNSLFWNIDGSSRHHPRFEKNIYPRLIKEVPEPQHPYTLKIGEVCEDEDGNRYLPYYKDTDNDFYCIHLKIVDGYLGCTLFKENGKNLGGSRSLIRKSPNQSREIIL